MGAIEFHGEASRGCHWQGHESKAGQAGFHISENTAAQLCIFKKKNWYDTILKKDLKIETTGTR